MLVDTSGGYKVDFVGMVDIVHMVNNMVLVDNVNITDSIDMLIYAEDFWLLDVGRMVAVRYSGNCEQHDHGGQQIYIE